jgi:hypothetical protein
MKLVQTPDTATLAYLPDQESRLETPFYSTGTPFALDRAGTGAVGLNILRPGQPPQGYTGGDKILVQKRVKQYFNGNEDDPDNTNFNYGLVVRAEPKGYTMREDERLDGDFFPGSINVGVGKPYGYSFPTGSTGQRQYNGDPFTPDGWSGIPHSVPNNPLAAPVIDSISPTSLTLPAGPTQIDITGSNFTGAGFVLIGPFLPGVIRTSEPSEIDYVRPDPPGAYFYRLIPDDTLIQIVTPDNLQAGVWDIIVVGADGQVGVLEQSFTVTDPAA